VKKPAVGWIPSGYVRALPVKNIRGLPLTMASGPLCSGGQVHSQLPAHSPDSSADWSRTLVLENGWSSTQSRMSSLPRHLSKARSILHCLLGPQPPLTSALAAVSATRQAAGEPTCLPIRGTQASGGHRGLRATAGENGSDGQLLRSGHSNSLSPEVSVPRSEFVKEPLSGYRTPTPGSQIHDAFPRASPAGRRREGPRCSVRSSQSPATDAAALACRPAWKGPHSTPALATGLRQVAQNPREGSAHALEGVAGTQRHLFRRIPRSACRHCQATHSGRRPELPRQVFTRSQSLYPSPRDGTREGHSPTPWSPAVQASGQRTRVF